MLGSHKCPLAFHISPPSTSPSSPSGSSNIKRPEGFHRILNPLWKRRVFCSVFSLSTDALKTWGFWQKLNWGVTKEQLHGRANPRVGFESLIKWIIRHIFSFDVPVLLPCHCQIVTVTPHGSCKSSSSECPQILTLPCSPGIWVTGQRARRAPQGTGTALGTGGDGLDTERDEPKDWQSDPRNSFCSGNCFTLCCPQEKNKCLELQRTPSCQLPLARIHAAGF